MENIQKPSFYCHQQFIVNSNESMQVSQPVNPIYASKIQQPIQANNQPLFLSTARQDPMFLSTARPPQYAPFATITPQQVYPVDGNLQSRIIDMGPASTYVPLAQPIVYSQHPQFIAPNGPAYLHPQFLVQPAPVIRRLPQQDSNTGFDSSEALKLCEVKMVESTVFCVVCGAEYKVSEKDQHIKKHVRKGHEVAISQEALKRLEQYHHQSQAKRNLLVKPIVEPEEVDMYYDPNVFQVIQEIIYEDESFLSKKEAGIGQEGNNSFNCFDNNVSISHNQPHLPVVFESQPNPFFSRHQKPHEYIIPEIAIPEPQIKPNQDNPILPNEQPIVYAYEPQIHYDATKQSKNLHAAPPSENVPIANTLNTYAPAHVNNHLEEHENSQDRLKEAKTEARPTQPTQKAPETASARFDSHEFKNFPEQIIQKMELNQHIEQESFSGPIEIKPPNQQSRKSTEVNISQFIRELNNAENERLEYEDRKRMPNQLEW